MVKILVSGASGIVGYGVLRSIISSSLNVKTVAATIYEDTIASSFADKFELAPLTRDPEYLPWLLDLIEKHSIQLLIPGIEDDYYFWSEHQNTIEQTGAKLLLNRKPLSDLCKDKWLFYQSLKPQCQEYLIPSSLSQDYLKLTRDFGSKLLLKPRRGFASKGIVTIESESEFEQHKNIIGEQLMVQPYIGSVDDEYTCAIFGDGEGNVLAEIHLLRTLSKEGFTQSAEVVQHSGISEAIKQLCRYLKPIGPTNLQFRLAQGQPKLLEINPRISSSTSIRTKFGYNEAEMALRFFLFGETIQQPEIKQGKAIRYIEDYIV